MSNTGGPAYPTNNYAAIVPISTGYSTWNATLDALEAANLAEDERKEIYTNAGKNLDFNTFLTRVTQAIEAKLKESPL